MNEITEVKFTKFMLKKHPMVVETMKRLRRYVGNTKNWGFTDEQKEEFDEKASRVRNLAESIYNSFKVSLCVWVVCFAFSSQYQSFSELI